MVNNGFNSFSAGGAGDHTLVVPTPGGSRPTSAASGAQAQAFFGEQHQPSIKLGNSLNPLVAAASKLLSVTIKLRTTMNHTKVPDLHKRLAAEIQHFEREAKQLALTSEIVLTARYWLCTVIDEVVLSTPWGVSSGWSQHSLLSLFHKETFGGEKCFAILLRTLETPGTNLELLELFYLCLSLGFQGKYRLVPRGHEQLEKIRDNLYQTIENHRPTMERDLSPHWQGCVEKSRRLIQYVPMWVIASVVFGLLAVVYSGYRWSLYNSATPVVQTIDSLFIEPTADSKPTP
ncbi:MAG: type IVB secretion system protein IcmH/DotU [Gammaproteobacteria bacterium]|nr:type IVB secretion system protein IcmH/DotU [Gammaproteobacteria bacterium]